MARILIAGAGGAASNGFIRSLRMSRRDDVLIGTNTSPTDLLLSEVDEQYVVPPANSKEYGSALLHLLWATKPDFLHVQPDDEVRRVSELRHIVKAQGTSLFLPRLETILVCQDKWESYQRWAAAKLPVPETRLIASQKDLERAFNEIGAPLWIRERRGAAGSGALSTSSDSLASAWIEHRDAWGQFTAARCLTNRTVTWQSIWWNGDLVVAQTRRRNEWAYSGRTPTGVTGITGVGETWSDPLVDDVAERAIRTIDENPHGIFGVDMVFDEREVPNPTEINVGRFFTTHEFFSQAGLNMPEIVVDLVLEQRRPELNKPVNPLPDGRVWIRGMDTEPILTTRDEIERVELTADVWRSRLTHLRGRKSMPSTE